MNEQTENYIILKPIAERFNKVAKEISDNDIKYIIKEAMKEQIKGIFDFNKLNEFTEEFIDKNEDEIKQAIADCIFDRLK
jgi:hypothetical protein